MREDTEIFPLLVHTPLNDYLGWDGASLKLESWNSVWVLTFVRDVDREYWSTAPNLVSSFAFDSCVGVTVGPLPHLAVESP